jgi:hypothetical protein
LRPASRRGCARIVELYGAWGKKDKAEAWKRRLATPADPMMAKPRMPIRAEKTAHTWHTNGAFAHGRSVEGAAPPDATVIEDRLSVV